MEKRDLPICSDRSMAQADWALVHNFLRSPNKSPPKTKSARKLAFSVIANLQKFDERTSKTSKNPSKINTTGTPNPKHRDFDTLQKEIKEWECLEYLQQTNPTLFAEFVSRKKRPAEFHEWLWAQEVKHSLAQTKLQKLRNALMGDAIFPFHPNLTKTTKEIIGRMRGKKETKMWNIEQSKVRLTGNQDKHIVLSGINAHNVTNQQVQNCTILIITIIIMDR